MLTVIISIGLIVIALHAIWLLFADGDMTLMWYERFGRKADALKGQVVWITGASSGIGQHLAYQFARVGCRLVLSARSVSQLEDVRKDCLACGRGLTGDDVLIVPLDVVDTASHAAATEKVLKAFGQIDVLVNNAGRSQRAWVAETELAVDKEMIDLNVIGQISLTKCVLPHMIKRRRGNLVITSSVAGKMDLHSLINRTHDERDWIRVVNNIKGVNPCNKEGWFHSLAIEVASENIGVTIACPGPVFSNITNVAFVGKSGQMYGRSAENDKGRMSTSRCAELMIIAVVNGLREVWISRHPTLLMTYFSQYMPSLTMRVMEKIGIKKIMAAREGN